MALGEKRGSGRRGTDWLIVEARLPDVSTFSLPGTRWAAAMAGLRSPDQPVTRARKRNRK